MYKNYLPLDLFKFDNFMENKKYKINFNDIEKILSSQFCRYFIKHGNNPNRFCLRISRCKNGYCKKHNIDTKHEKLIYKCNGYGKRGKCQQNVKNRKDFCFHHKKQLHIKKKYE